MEGHLLRSLGIKILKEVERGSFLDETLSRYFERKNLNEKERDLLYEITSGAIRWKGYFDWILSHLIDTPPKRDTLFLLYISLYQLSFLKKAPYHVVKETVEFVKRFQGREVAGFINAVLKRFLKEKDSILLPSDSISLLSVKYSFPLWLVKRWVERFGKERTEKILQNLNRRPKFCLRIDSSKLNRTEVIELLKKEGIPAFPGRYVDSAIYVEKLRSVINHRLFKEGLISVQDEASQMAVHLLEPKEHEKILDAGSGLGTKRKQIEEVAKASVFSIDKNKNLLSLKRKGFILGDCLYPPFKKEIFDKILLDSPCSSLGVLRKHPEIKWRRREEEIEKFALYQFELIKSLYENVKKNGLFVYSVCTFEKEETEDLINKVESLFPLRVEKIFLSIPEEYEMDGFFIAKMRRL